MTLTQINKAGLDEIALDHVFTIGASGSSAYTFQGEGLNGTVNNPTLYLTRGKTYRFENGSGGHPIRIQSTSGASGTAYNTGVTNNAGSGTVIVEVQHDAPDVLYYQCTSHAAMNGILYITGALADGGVTTAKIAADAVTGAKIADDAINSEHYTDGSIDAAHIADDAVTTAKLAAGSVDNTALADNSINGNKLQDNCVATSEIQDEAVTLAKLPHGTSSNDGKFLRANNGADPTFESLPASGATLSGSTNNTVVTVTGANAMQGESSLTYNGSDLNISNDTPQLLLTDTNSNNSYGRVRGNGGNLILSADHGGATAGSVILAEIDGSEKVRIDSSGNVGIGTTSPSHKLHVVSSATDTAFFKGRIIRFDGAAASNSPRLNLSLDGTDKTSILLNRTDSSLAIETLTAAPIKFFTNSTERARILSTGGITFNGDTAAANALDDYEEGQYVPTMYGQNGTTSFDLHSGESKLSYQKVGNTVTIHGRIRINNNNFSGAAYMTLPFTAADNDDTDNAGSSAIAVHGVDYGGSRRTLFLETGGNSAYAWFLIVRDNSSWLSASSSNLLSNSYLSFVHSYKVA